MHHTVFIENEKLITKQNHLQHCIKMSQAKQGVSNKNEMPERNEIQKKNNQLNIIRQGYGVLNGHKEFKNREEPEQPE
jgi:hypothetical protein